jgi:hypothetical protein
VILFDLLDLFLYLFAAQQLNCSLIAVTNDLPRIIIGDHFRDRALLKEERDASPQNGLDNKLG